MSLLNELKKFKELIVMEKINNIHIGFGPITKNNSFLQSGKKVAKILENDKRFRCNFFSWNPFNLKELVKFNVIIFIKYLHIIQF